MEFFHASEQPTVISNVSYLLDNLVDNNMSIMEIMENMCKRLWLNREVEMEGIDLSDQRKAVSAESFEEIKDALRKTLHVMIDLDFQDGKLDGAINCFLAAKKFQISLTVNLNPNDVILIRNLTKNKVTPEVLENIRKARNGLS